MPKNFKVIPASVLHRLKTFALDDVVVATAKRVRREEIANYAHLGLRLGENGTITIPEPFVPNPESGKYSLWNIEGKEIIRKDLPKIDKEFSFYAPSWDSGSYHLVTHTREVYRRDFIPPKDLTISVALLGEQDGAYQLKFAVDQVINRNADDFEDDLLYNLNILQENLGSVDVFQSDATLADYLATIRVDWELLPAGETGALEKAYTVLSSKRKMTPEQEATVKERMSLFAKLKPTHFVAGTSGFARYFGAMYGDDFVAFENLRYGNALYVMFDNWQTLSRKSRVDLLKGDYDGFERIEHKGNWASRFEAMLEAYRDKKRRQRR